MPKQDDYSQKKRMTIRLWKPHDEDRYVMYYQRVHADGEITFDRVDHDGKGVTWQYFITVPQVLSTLYAAGQLGYRMQLGEI